MKLPIYMYWWQCQKGQGGQLLNILLPQFPSHHPTQKKSDTKEKRAFCYTKWSKLMTLKDLALLSTKNAGASTRPTACLNLFSLKKINGWNSKNLFVSIF